jgi:hypothetical protein
MPFDTSSQVTGRLQQFAKEQGLKDAVVTKQGKKFILKTHGQTVDLGRTWDSASKATIAMVKKLKLSLDEDTMLHASYSRRLANESSAKGLVKLAKDRGINSPDVWFSDGNWAMRFTDAHGETKQCVLGAKFADARGRILSLASASGPAAELKALKKAFPKAQISITPNGELRVRSDSLNITGKTASDIIKRAKQLSLAEPKEIQANVKQLLERAKKVGLTTARVSFDGKNYRMNYGGKVYNLGPSRGEAMSKIGKVRPVKD